MKNYTERIEDLGGGLFQPISEVEHQEHPGDVTDFFTTCKVCGKNILTEDGNPGYCEEHE